MNYTLTNLAYKHKKATKNKQQENWIIMTFQKGQKKIVEILDQEDFESDEYIIGQVYDLNVSTGDSYDAKQKTLPDFKPAGVNP